MAVHLSSNHHWRELFSKSIFSLIGVAILAIGATLCKQGHIGLDPFTALNIGLSNKLHMSLGIYQLLVNVLIIVLVFFLDRKKIGIGTVINMVFAGFMIEWFSRFYISVFHYHPSILTMMVNGILGLLLFTLGTSLYMSANLGVAPYDAIAPIASARLHIKYRFCRIAQDLAFMIGALIASGPIGLATIIIAFFAGPLITFYDKYVSSRLVSKVVEFSAHPSGRSIGHGFTGAGRYTYHLVKQCYEQTMEVQKKLSHYSDEQLQQKQEQARLTIKDAKAVIHHTTLQYGLLKEEEQRRENLEKKEEHHPE
ncbi:membrane protein [Sporolactobacillus shoreae]|uniref:Membrane protein n=1 Tax=Sporolactobacillus shoreae TaxID=1465501 RepID=A0A4Z0GLP5_9BACL|nr:YitT family protein [Sporolactobacillus shoreae]TGA97016.1 membrane protein [Sporolactobacillus shoreae]